MIEPRFESLQETLIRAGVAASHAQRAALEMDCHFREHVAKARKGGAGGEAAREDAHRAMGSDETVVGAFIARPELQSWAARHRALCFGLLPLLCFAGVCATSFAVAAFVDARVSTYLRIIHIRPGVTVLIDQCVRGFFLWTCPILICAAFGALAYRQRVPLRWPVLGISVLCALVALLDLEVMLYGGTEPGYARGGIGISPEFLPGQMAHAAAMLAVVLGPLHLATSRLRRRIRLR